MMATVTSEQLAYLDELRPSDVLKAYSGKAGRCCCGCSGTYYYNSARIDEGSKERGYKVDADDVNDLQLKRVLRLVQADCDDCGSNYFAARVGKRLYIVYPTAAKRFHSK